MIINAVKSYKKSDGASFGDIIKYLEENFYVDMKELKPYVSEALIKGVHNEMFEKITSSYSQKKGHKRKLFEEERFRINEKNIFKAEQQNEFPNYETDVADKRVRDDAAASNKNLEMKTETSLPTLEMVTMTLKNALKNLNKRNGASFDEISTYMEEKYKIDMENLRPYIKNIFDKCVDNGIFEKVRKAAANVEEKFRIKENDKVQKKPEDLLLTENTYARAKKRMNVSAPSKIKPDIKTETSTPTREMLIIILKNSMKNLNKRNGASFDEISKYMEDHHKIDTEANGSYIRKILNECIDKGIFEKISRSTNMEEKYRIKKKRNDNEESETSFLKVDVDAQAKKTISNLSQSKKNFEINATTSPTREMVLTMFKNASKYLQKQNGVSFDEMSKYMEENYRVNMKVFRSHIKNIFDECIINGMFVKISNKNSKKERFKFREPKNITRDTKNLRLRGRKK